MKNLKITASRRLQCPGIALACFAIAGCSDSEQLEKARAATAAVEAEKIAAEAALADAKARLVKAEADAEKAKLEAERDRAALDALRGLQQKGSDLPPVEQPRPDWTPQQVLAAYFNAASLAHRFPFIYNIDSVKPLMESHYGNQLVSPVRDVTIGPSPRQEVPVGNSIRVSVKLTTEPAVDYVLVRTDSGFRIDWQASKANWLAAQEAAFRSAHGLENAAIVIEELKARNVGPHAQYSFRVTNASDATVSSARLKLDALDADNRFLGHQSILLGNIAPRASTIEQATVINVKVDQIKSWEVDPSRITIDLGPGNTITADQYFRVEFRTRADESR